jgi:Tol biopolymer transport system component
MKHNPRYFLNIILLVFLLAACEQKQTTATTEVAGGTKPAASVSSSPTPGTNFISSTSVPTTPSTDANCNVEWSRLRVGYTAYVTWGDRANRVRSEPTKSADNVIAELYSGNIVNVIAGPVCADGYMYWKVENETIPGGSGWTAEGDGNRKHWLDPYNCASDRTALYLNHYAIVASGVKGLRVYDKQGIAGTVITQISGGDLLKVVGGPYCTDNTADKLVYWKVENETIPDGSGWVAEYGYEGTQYQTYLDYYAEADPVAFPRPSSIASIEYKPSASMFKLSDLGGLGRIAYITNDWVWVINADGTDPYELLNPVGRYDTPRFVSWSPDGKYLATTVGKKMFILSLDREEAYEPVDKAGYYSDPEWSPDSQFLAFSYEDDTSSNNIYVVHRNGTNLRQVSTDINTGCFEPFWSPFGKNILYTCFYQGGMHIYISAYDAPGRQTFEAMGDDVAWSPDGKYIAYADSEDGLSIMNANGSGAHTLVAEEVGSFAWSPDSKSVAFIFGDQVFLVNIADNAVRNLTGYNIKLPFIYAYGWLSWSPDSKYITYAFDYLYNNNSISESRISPIFIVEVSTGAKQQLVEKGTYPAWAPVIPAQIKQLPDCTSEWSRLKAGEQARVMGSPTDPPNRVRSGPSTSDEQIGVIYPGAILELLEGPVCADSLVFWKVKNDTIPGKIGWTAEGDGMTYWLEPYKP